MEIELHPTVLLESGTFSVLVAPPEMLVPRLNAVLRELERFLVLYVCGNYSRLLSRVHRSCRNLEIRRSFTAFQLLQILEESHHTFVFIEYDPTLFSEERSLQRCLPRACRDVAHYGIVVIYAPEMDRYLRLLARDADRVFHLGVEPPQRSERRSPAGRHTSPPPGQTTLEVS
ncbi:MAG: hypothetical protein QHG99_00225 [Methanomicrobiales archaeon]|nr:hypothetical protein [Methanomicrobiales archaeon]